MSRERTVCMMRVRNEARWIARSLDRTFEVARTVVLFDDGSTDETLREARRTAATGLARVLHVLPSPFRTFSRPVSPVRERETVNEVRDKNVLWFFAKAHVDFDHVLCLDGDEILSKQAVSEFGRVWKLLNDGTDVVSLPFLYLWNDEAQRRVDGIYGDDADGQPVIRHARIFTVQRLTADELYDTYFAWDQAGCFHCGSIPATRGERAAGQRGGQGRSGICLPLPVMHMGYLEDAERRRKFEFYNRLDPHNRSEGEYRHIIGEPDLHAPGPVELRSWRDEVPKIKVNVGSGSRPMPGYINTDVRAHPGTDRVCQAWDLGLMDESVEELQCHHVIEHFFPKDWLPTLAEFWRVLAPGGRLVMSCPDFGEIARGYTEGRYTINDARMVVMATVPPFNSCDYDDPASYHRTVHSEESLVADLRAQGFVDFKIRHDEQYRWNLFFEVTKPDVAFVEVTKPDIEVIKPNVVLVEATKPDEARSEEKDFVVAIVSPAGYVHSAVFKEVALALCAGLKALGKTAHVLALTGPIIDAGDSHWIVLGAHLLERLPSLELPRRRTIYNFEAHGTEMWNMMLPHAKAAPNVWDFSQQNVTEFEKLGISATFVPPGYSPELERIPQTNQDRDIDVLFYGSINDRRRKVLDELRAEELVVHNVEGLYGGERELLIARSKVVLNLHHYENPGLFESARVSYLLANEVCVISETGVGQDGYDQGAVCVPYDQLVSTCVRYVKNDAMREMRGRLGHELFKSTFDEIEILREVLKEKMESRTTLCLIVIGSDTTSFEKMDFLELAKRESEELVLIKTKHGLFGGQGAVFNRVLDRTLCDVVAVVHADTTFGPGALTTFARTAAEGKVTGLVGRMSGQYANGQGYAWSKNLKEETAVSTLDACSVFLRRDSRLRFDEVTFDSWHCCVEDVCLQAAERGIPIIVPVAHAHHHGGTYLDLKWQEAYRKAREKLVIKWAGVEFNTT